MGRADAVLIRGITRVLLTPINAVALRQISMHGLIRSLDSSHWLLILIHINECMNEYQLCWDFWIICLYKCLYKSPLPFPSPVSWGDENTVLVLLDGQSVYWHRHHRYRALCYHITVGISPHGRKNALVLLRHSRVEEAWQDRSEGATSL